MPRCVSRHGLAIRWTEALHQIRFRGSRRSHSRAPVCVSFYWRATLSGWAGEAGGTQPQQWCSTARRLSPRFLDSREVPRDRGRGWGPWGDDSLRFTDGRCSRYVTVSMPGASTPYLTFSLFHSLYSVLPIFGHCSWPPSSSQGQSRSEGDYPSL
jgi:hypothetical protein